MAVTAADRAAYAVKLAEQAKARAERDAAESEVAGWTTAQREAHVALYMALKRALLPFMNGPRTAPTTLLEWKRVCWEIERVTGC